MSTVPEQSQVAYADALAEAALDEMKRDTVIGLGAGHTAARGIRALAERYKSDLGKGIDLNIRCVCGSEASEQLAHELGLPVVDFATIEQVDTFIDGADEIDRGLRVMKGARGAMTRERMIAWASARNVYMVRDDKVSDHIGEKQPLAIAVFAFGLESIRAELRAIGLNGVVRRTLNGDLFITDNGNLVLDCTLEPGLNLREIAQTLNDIPGVVDHGMFLDEADVILIEHRDEQGQTARIERLVRPED